MPTDYLLLEDGVSRLILEDGTGNLILESSTAGPSTAQMVPALIQQQAWGLAAAKRYV
jgi:hypothetical protein